MLVLFFGPSCTGKTTVIRQLSSSYGWIIVPTETTRAVRPGETEKENIDLPEFEQKRLDGYYLCSNFLFDNWYGTPLSSINSALNSIEPHLLDMPIQSRHTIFREIHHLGVVMLPESRNTLLAQIRSANREERIESIMNEYDSEYASLPVRESDSTLRCIPNYFGNIERTVDEVFTCISQFQREQQNGNAY